MKRECQVISPKARKCRNKGIRKVQYHGEHEIYFGTSISWVEINVCKKHSDALEKRGAL